MGMNIKGKDVYEKDVNQKDVNEIDINGNDVNGKDVIWKIYHVMAWWDVMAHWLRRLFSTGGSWVRLPLWPSHRDLGQVLYLQLPVRFGVKLRYSIRAVVGSASEWYRT